MVRHDAEQEPDSAELPAAGAEARGDSLLLEALAIPDETDRAPASAVRYVAAQGDSLQLEVSRVPHETDRAPASAVRYVAARGDSLPPGVSRVPHETDRAPASAVRYVAARGDSQPPEAELAQAGLQEDSPDSAARGPARDSLPPRSAAPQQAGWSP